MPAHEKVLGILTPVGGGDPIPLYKPELLVGRRPTCDISLAFENISGKHCELKLVKNVWHVRDLGSTNGTYLNGARLAAEKSVMPDDELRIGSHLYTIDYEPGGPGGAGALLEDDEVVEAPKKTSLLELAGLAEDEDMPRKRRQDRAPDKIERPSVDEAGFDDPIPTDVPIAPPLKIDAGTDDFFKLFEDEVNKPEP